MRKLFLCVAILFVYLNLCSQEFGGNPASVKWRQLNTDTARIIFPVGLDSQANRVASIIHLLAKQKPFSLGDQLKKINVVLQNQTTIPNGYVQLGPFRSEFYMTPAFNNFDQGTIPWADQLAIHEYRHVQQFNNFNNGLSSVARTLFGQDGFTLAINASIPDWFYEGDAVYQETVLTGQGRGRIPQFLNAFPSLWQAGKKYSWMKLRNGSFKDYVPNHYNLGYLLVNYGREKYGADFWTKVTKDASSFRGLFYPFQAAVKKYAGTDFKNFTNEAFEYYKKKTERTAVSRDEYLEPVNKNFVTSYYYPYSVTEDSLLYLKASFRHRPAFYIRDKSGEHRLRTRDISIDEQFSYRNGKVVYAAFESDPRWDWRNYSVLKVLNVHTGRQITLTKKTKYFSPDISNDGSKVAAVQFSEDGKSELHILDAISGSVINSFSSADINLFTDPKFSEDDKEIVSPVRLNSGDMTLASVNIASGEINRLLPASYNVIGYPSINNGVIFFSASFEGNDDVFALRITDKKLFRISDGPLGNYFANVANGKITWSAFTAEGYQLKQINLGDIKWNEVKVNTENIVERFEVDTKKDATLILPDNLNLRNFISSKYSKTKGLLNFHSWRPYYEDPIFTFSLYGENVINTMQTEIYYLYNQNEKTNAVGLNATYGGLFPYISAGTEFTFDRERITGNKLRRWNQLDSRLGFIIPLNYTSGQTFKNLTISNYYVLRNEFNRGFFKDSIGNTSFSYLSHNISWTQQIQQAVQHIYPRFAYSISSSYRYPITRYEGYQFYASASLYLPGILSTHNLVLSGAIQQRDTSRLIFSSRLANARGFADYYGTNAGSRLWRLSANYHLPLWYPDWGVGNILYLQRLRANVFYDFQRLFSNDKLLTLDLRSVGVEFYVDTKWWNQYPLTFGCRISRLLDDDPLPGVGKGATMFEFILPVSIIPR